MAYQEGQQLSNYRLIRLLGKGSFTEVYLGEHVQLKTRVAIKVFFTQLTNDNTRDFINEVRAIAKLEHYNIIEIFDFGLNNNDIPYLVTQYIPNGTLRQRHPKGSPVPLGTVISYTKQIASALQYAHDHAIVHRNVKPENMLLGSNNDVLLTDFGIATTISDEALSIEDIAGTLTFMAPEQFKGEVQPASDQYALAVVVYEWLTGKPPFSGSYMEVAMKHLRESPPPLSTAVPTIPYEVELVVIKALAKKPQDRFPSILKFANALEQASKLGTSASELRTTIAPSMPDPTIVSKSPPPPFPYSPVFDDDDDTIFAAPPSPPMPAQSPSSPSTSGYFSEGDDTRTIRAETPLLPSHSSASYDDDDTPPRTVQAETPSLPSYSPTVVRLSSREESEYRRLLRPPIPRSISGLSSFFTGAGNALTNLFSSRGRKKQQETQLSLFAIARTTLEYDDRAIVGKVYTAQAGISQNRPENFRSEPFRVPVQNPTQPLVFDILLHPSENIELMEGWFRRLSYDPRGIESQFVSFPFRLKAPFRSYLIINFYRERQWLKTIRFEFDGIDQAVLADAIYGR